MSSAQRLTLDPSSQRNRFLKPVSESKILSTIHGVSPSAVVPADFIAFYLQYNGGSFVECVLPGSPLGPVVVAQLLACDDQDSYSLERAFAYLQAEGETQLLPFAEDPSGSLFVIDAASGDGAVHLWNHETRASTKVSQSCRSKVAPDALWFGASVHRMGGWRALVMNRDRTLDVNWSGTRAVNVVAGTFLQRNRTAWPMLESPDELPNLVPGIEAILEKRFIRHAEVDAHSLKSQDLETLRRWLLPVCDTIDFQLGALHGALPTNVDCEDRRAERMGIDIRISAEVSLSFAVGT